MHQRRLENKAQTGESRRMDHQARQGAPRQRIIKAARKLFDAKGFHAPTTAELARSEAHTTELQSLMRNSYAGFCLKKKKTTTIKTEHQYTIIRHQQTKNMNILL